MTLRLTQSRSIETVFMIKHSFSVHARRAKVPNSDMLTAGAIDVFAEKNQKMVQDSATARRCMTVFPKDVGYSY